MDVGLIFDLDGTLLDSTFIIGQVMNETRLSLGYPHLEFDVYDQLIGLPPIELVSDLSLDSQEKESIINIFRRNLPNALNEGVPTFVDTIETLKILESRGFEFGIATSKPTNLAVQFVSNSELAQFDFTIQGTDDGIYKPDPKVIKDCVSKMNCQKYVMIGDRTEDIVAGVSAGIMSCGIAQTSHSYFQLKQAGAYVVVDKISRLIKYL